MKKIIAVLVGLFAALGTIGSPEPEADKGAVVRILTPPGIELRGRSEVETLAIDPEIREIVVFVGGEEAARRGRPPWNVKVVLADPPREQTVEVKAYGDRGRELGSDRVVVNRRPIAFRVRITSIRSDAEDGTLHVEADVSVPHDATLDSVDFYLGEDKVATVSAPPFTATIPAGAGSFVRAVATLRGGRTSEDVEVPGASAVTEEIDVNLVQVQVLATRENGAPVTDLRREDFEVLQGGQARQIESFYPAPDVALVLGLVLDSSGSMRDAWSTTLATAKQFLRQTIGERDRAFLVDFDEQLRLAHGLTGDLGELYEALDALEPEGGTALYDSILFSLLQFEAQPGRRALVVLTDGYDSRSTTDERHAVEFGRKLGVPVYVVALPSGGGPGDVAVHALKLVTDPTGGRLLRVGSAGGLERAFAQIAAELRHQYVLTCYTDELPGDGRRKITVRLKDRKDVEVRAVFAWDQMS
jgi:VWFA-related protein